MYAANNDFFYRPYITILTNQFFSMIMHKAIFSHFQLCYRMYFVGQQHLADFSIYTTRFYCMSVCYVCRVRYCLENLSYLSVTFCYCYPNKGIYHPTLSITQNGHDPSFFSDMAITVYQGELPQ